MSIHRTLIGHPAFRNDSEAMAFAWMVIRAAWKPARVRYKERAITLQRGQLSVSQRDMANALDRDKAWVERLWKRLKNEAMIMVAVEAGVAVITICNYDIYQNRKGSGEAADEAQPEAGARQGQGTEQEAEKDKKEELDICPSGDEPTLKPEHVVEEWNNQAAQLGKPTVRDLTPSRRQLIKARIGQYALDDFLTLFTKIQTSQFLRDGRFCTFDWCMKAANFQKILEGNYDG